MLAIYLAVGQDSIRHIKFHAADSIVTSALARGPMMRKLATLLTIGFGFLLVAAPALAHHGIAAYQSDKQVTIMGTVTAFTFSNPHALVYLNVKLSDGSIAKWQGELTSPNNLSRVGWTKRTIGPGEQITISGYPAKNGGSSIWIRKIVKSDGTELPVSISGE